MEALIRAIKERFDDEYIFKEALTGGLHLGLAPQDVDVDGPYAVLAISSEPFWTFNKELETYAILINIVSSKSSISEMFDLYDKCKNCFDDCDLYIEGAHLLRFWRVSSDLSRLENRWIFAIQYNCQIERT